MTVRSSVQANGGLNKWGARTLLRSKQYHILSSVGGHEAQCKRCKCVTFLIEYVTKAM